MTHYFGFVFLATDPLLDSASIGLEYFGVVSLRSSMLVRPYCRSSALPKHVLLLAKEEKYRDKTSDAKIFGFGRNILLTVVYGTTLVIRSNCTGCGLSFLSSA